MRQMIKRVVDDHAVTSRVFITGLSSGGAMTAVMLATYPEDVRGRRDHRRTALPQRTPDAGDLCMKGYGGPSDLKLGNACARSLDITGRWPTISVWHGGSDRKTVDSSNADSIVRQWQKIHNVEGPPTRVEDG
jgi:poly(3-hydroxybutyrate) depolymerase